MSGEVAAGVADFAAWAEFIKSVGVPAGIAFLVLWRLDSRLAELTKAVTTLISSTTLQAADAAIEAKVAAGIAAAALPRAARLVSDEKIVAAQKLIHPEAP